MRHSRIAVRILAATLLAALPLSVASAQVSPKSFGTQDAGVTVVSTFDFHTLFSTSGFTWASGYSAASGAGNLQLAAGFGNLPHGVRLDSFTVYYSDLSAADNLRFRACRKSFDAASGEANAQDCFVEFFSSGQGGAGAVELPVPAGFQNYLLTTDVDFDDDDDVVDYFFVVDTPGGILTAIGPVLIRWHRQVSPAPAVARFNDVPSSDPAFQFIEALAASGITVGCGGPNYCPDSPLTRRQMAVFLAKALGLHWAP